MTHECCAHAKHWKERCESLGALLVKKTDRVVELAAENHDLRDMMGPDYHVAQIGKHDVALQHPVACRRNLLGCAVHLVLDGDGWLPPYDLVPGRYVLTLEEGELVFGDPVDEDGYPIDE